MSNIKKFNGETMCASEYYYDVQPDAWDDMLYPEAIKDRQKRSWDLFCKLQTQANELPMNKPLPEELSLRINKTRRAFEDNKQLCDEKSLII